MYQGERFNSISHLVGAIMALAGLVVVVVMAARQGDPWKVVVSQTRPLLDIFIDRRKEVAPFAWTVFLFFKWNIYLFYAACSTVGSITA